MSLTRFLTDFFTSVANRRLLTLCLILSIIGSALIFAKPSAAATFQLSGRVGGQSGNPLPNSTVDVINHNSQAVTATTSTDTNGHYAVSIDQGTYDVRVTPPSGSGFNAAVALNRNITGDTVLDFILVSAGSVTLSGKVLDALGNGLSGVRVVLGATEHFTDGSGNYSFQVTSGDYTLDVTGGPSATTPHFNFHVFSFSLSQSIVADLSLPLKKVSVHVQDSSNNPVNNVKISTGGGGGIGVPLGPFSANGSSQYLTSDSVNSTDSSGNADLWLVPPTRPDYPYTLTANPPIGSNFPVTDLQNVTFSSDASFTITLATPVTLSGKVLDALGNELGGVRVVLYPPTGNAIEHTTDSSGNYSFQVTSGDYRLDLIGGPYTNAPRFNMTTTFSLTQNTNADLTLPLKKIGIHVKDSSGNPVSNVNLSTGGGGGHNLPLGPFTASSASSQYLTVDGRVTNASGDVDLWLFPTSGSNYTFTATPPNGSNFPITDLSGVEFSADTSVTITLATPVTLSGKVLDALGNGLSGVRVVLGATEHFTDGSGNYSFQVTSGDYSLDVSDGPSATTPHFNFHVSSFSLNQNTVADLSLPLKKVSVHVQDSFSNPIANVDISTGGGGGPMPLGPFGASGSSFYAASDSMNNTDASGNVDLWLLPTTRPDHPYTLIVTPPSESIYATFNIENVSVTEDKSLVITLEFVHNPPVTTATLSPSPNAQNEYQDPTTVTLSAVTASGFTIANTYYTFDGGLPHPYSSPFTVSGSGGHTITYWSIDNVGVFESANTKMFTIVSNQAPSVNLISGGTINEGGTYTTSGSFTDPDSSTSWTAIVDYGDDSAEQPLPLSGMDFLLSHVYQDNGSYTVIVKITDNQGATDTETATVNVTNVAPSVNTPVVSPGLSMKGSVVTTSAMFSDPGPNDAPFTCIVNYGDGSGDLVGTVSGNTCTGPSHTYTNIGSFTVTVSVTDKDNGTGSNSTTHAVIYSFTGFFQPVDNLPIYNTVKAGQAIPVRFSLGGNQGLNIFAAGYPKSEIIQCDSNAQVDGIEETVTAGTSSLSYDPVTNTYTYIWKTDKAWGNTCRQLVVKFNDGTFHRANFKFTK